MTIMRGHVDQSEGVMTNQMAWWPINGHDYQSESMMCMMTLFYLGFCQGYKIWIMSFLIASIDHFDGVGVWKTFTVIINVASV